jgi:hypothetical protein
MVNMASLKRSREDEVEDRLVDVMGCIRLFYSNFAIFIVLGYKGGLVISSPINRTPKGWWRGNHSAISLPPPSHRCFLRGVGVVHGVRGEGRGEKVRDPSNPPKSGRMLWSFPHIVDV